MVELISGFPLFLQQYKALLKKNFILMCRNKRSTFLQLFSSFIVLLLIFSVEEYSKMKIKHAMAIDNRISSLEYPIPACDRRFVLKTPCYDFVWSGNGSPQIEEIVKRIMRNNPGRPISEDRVKSFHTPDDVDAWVLSNPKRTAGALHFGKRNNTIISYGIQTDGDLEARKGSDGPVLDLQLALLLAAEREIARSLLQDSNFSWTVGLEEFARIIQPSIFILSEIGPSFLLAIAMFSFVFQTAALVTERELKLRQAMSMMGLYESAYWLSWLTWEAMLVFISSLLTVLFGMMFRFDFFRFNSFAVLFLVFYLFSLSMVAFAFTISNFIRKASSTITVGFAIFTACFVLNGIDLYEIPMKKSYKRLMSLFPPILFSRALHLLNKAVEPENNRRGISWSKRGDCGGKECHWTIDDVLKWYIYVFFLWIFVAIYLDNIIPNSNGVRKSVLYFLKPSYWTGKGSDKVEEGSILSLMGALPEVEVVTPGDDDVLAEETTVKRQAHDNVIDPNIAVQIQGLIKVYPGSTSIGFIKLVRTGAFQAVKGLWINFPKNQLFCLLGPNGAGKTTAISCLTGITPVTGGDALIYGNSVRNTVGMSNIRKIIGVCPQFDNLWDALSGREHLHLFSSIKGLPPLTIESETEKSLEQVKLTSAAEVRAGSYSGGMKRRLSVAIALIGDPKLVFLDEPTTGMDPISRRQVWNIIEDAKKGRAIVLTTHSMEEADILSDRIAIMTRGRLQCLGTSIRLKSKFGSGYVATVSFPGNSDDDDATSADQAEPVKKFFKDHLNVKPTKENKKFATFIIPNENEPLLTKFFAELQEREEELGISDIQLGFTSLEEVFLKIVKQSELETAAAEGTLLLVTLPNGKQIQVPKGARFVGIPNTESPQHPRGLMFEVYWEQDEDGALALSGCSDECPIPESAHPTTKPLTSASTSGSIPIGFAVTLERS